MTIQQKIKADLQKARKEKDEIKKNVLIIIMGELARIDTKKEIEDQRIINLLNKMADDAKKFPVPDEVYISILKQYIPQPISEEELLMWISNHIDFSSLKNKMQAIGIIKNHFGTKADGKMISSIIKDKF